MAATLLGCGALAFLAGLVWWSCRQQSQPATRGLPHQTDLRYTKHVRDRMQQRGVAQDQLLSALHNPDRLVPDPSQNSMKLEKDFEGQTLKVWVAHTSDAPWPPPPGEVILKSTAWRFHLSLPIDPKMHGRVIGKGGSTVKDIQQSSGARVHVREGAVNISAGTKQELEAAKSLVLGVIDPSRRAQD